MKVKNDPDIIKNLQPYEQNIFKWLMEAVEKKGEIEKVGEKWKENKVSVKS